jgi:hypothetical protein
MLTTAPKSDYLAALGGFAGTYAGQNLVVAIARLGRTEGVQITWDWASRDRDVGLVGHLDAQRLCMAHLCNSQPWLGRDCLRLFEAGEREQDGETTTFRFTCSTPTQEGAPAVEVLALTFGVTGTLMFAYEFVQDGPTRRTWALAKES